MYATAFVRPLFLCQAGKDHQALLQLDVIRAWLGLPASAHPPMHPPSPEMLDDE